jgi:hypothetical protein
MAKTKTTPYDTDYLKTEEDGRCILKPAFIAKALGDIARASAGSPGAPARRSPIDATLQPTPL